MVCRVYVWCVYGVYGVCMVCMVCAWCVGCVHGARKMCGVYMKGVPRVCMCGVCRECI